MQIPSFRLIDRLGRFLRRKAGLGLLILAMAFSAAALRAEDAKSPANLVFAEALKIYADSQGKDEAGQKAAAVEVMRLFDLIVTAYPESLPAKKIQAGGKVGPINLAELRTTAGLAGTGTAASSAGSAPTANVEPPAPENPPKPRNWMEDLVAGGTAEGGYVHGQYPSQGQRTHPGLDVVSACGAELRAPWDATVERVEMPGTTDFPRLGNAIFLRFEANSYVFHSAFLGLAQAPKVQTGSIKAGQAFGVTGKLHDLAACGVHVEFRDGPATGGGLVPYWHAALPVGDWRKDPAFEYQLDPASVGPRITDAMNAPLTGIPPVGGEDWIHFFDLRTLASYDLAKNLTLSERNAEKILITASVSLQRRGTDLILLLRGASNSTPPMNGSLVEAVKAGEKFQIEVAGAAGSTDPAPQIAEIEVRIGTGYAVLSEPVQIALSSRLLSSEVLKLSLVGDKGSAYPLGRIGLAFPASPPGKPNLALATQATQLAQIARECVDWPYRDGVTISVPGRIAATAFELGDLRKAEFTGTDAEKAMAKTFLDDLKGQLSTCKGLVDARKSTTTATWVQVQIVLGRRSK